MALRYTGQAALLLVPIASYIFLWIPIVVLIAFSFNDSRSVATWHGFTTRWYDNIITNAVGSDARFSTDQMLQSLTNSMRIAVPATIIATIIGTLTAISLVRSNFIGKRWLQGLLYLTVAIPEIAFGISLLMFFNRSFTYLNEQLGGHLTLTFGFTTMIIAHVTFSISYVAIVVSARLANMSKNWEEAAQDLGANNWRTFWRVTFPLALPGIVAGALLVFTMSLDDYVISFFTSGIGTTTLTMYVYGLLKLTITPEINAMSTLMIVASALLVSLSLFLQRPDSGWSRIKLGKSLRRLRSVVRFLFPA
ncbi:MAG: ABC transporter permease [Anaerolineales bacterium]|nr:ABC transporter permease [Anaerolineales bacterium]